MIILWDLTFFCIHRWKLWNPLTSQVFMKPIQMLITFQRKNLAIEDVTEWWVLSHFQIIKMRCNVKHFLFHILIVSYYCLLIIISPHKPLNVYFIYFVISRAHQPLPGQVCLADWMESLIFQLRSKQIRSGTVHANWSWLQISPLR